MIIVLKKNIMLISFYRIATMIAVLFIRIVSLITVLIKMPCFLVFGSSPHKNTIFHLKLGLG